MSEDHIPDATKMVQPLGLASTAELGLVERLRQRGNALRCHPAANGTVGHTEEAGELLAAAATEIERLRFELGYAQGQINQADSDKAKAVAAERERCAAICEREICACCWDADAQAAAEHLAAEIRKA